MHSLIGHDKYLVNTKILTHLSEIDIYIPEKNFAIEFNGNFWHSELRGKDKNYHLNKTELCYNQNVVLFHIFEDEWEFKQEIIESMIKYRLGLTEKRIYARQCEIKNVDIKTSVDFLEKNHIQGNVGSSIKLGLFFENELVSLLSIGKPRFNKRYEYEIIRYASKLNTTVIGGFSKLLKYFEKSYNPKNIISYADRRFSNGGLYQNNNFNLINKSAPNYFYVKGITRQSRLIFQKHKLPNLLEKFDPNMTEVENMRINGYDRIFDCGNLVYVKEY